MPLSVLLIVGVVAVVGVSVFARRLGVAAPIALVLAGVAIGFLPGTPDIEIDPEWVLAGVLPPLLYSAAIDMPAVDFRRDFSTISGLAVVLVAITTAAGAVVVHALLPAAGWPAAFAVGAVISPTDAVAATSVGRKLGLPPRLLTLLEGEGLVNDASALTFLRSAIAAMSGTVSLWEVAGDFVRAVLISVVVGFVVGHVNVRVRRLLPDAVTSTAVAFVVPFVAFLPAEHLNGSGVLSVVVAGLITGHLRFRYLGASQRVTEATNWRTIAFLLEGGIFFSMGLGLQGIREDVIDHHLGFGIAVGTGLLVAVVAMILRLVVVTPLVWRLRRSGVRAAELKPVVADRFDTIAASPEAQERWHRLPEGRRESMRHRATRLVADLDFRARQRIGWRGGMVIGWAGMRGAITVAAAQTLPADTPLRSQLVLVAYVVAFVTLIVQGTTLPAVIRAVGVPEHREDREREERLRGELTDAALESLRQSERDENEGVRRAAASMREDIESRAEVRASTPEIEAERGNLFVVRRQVLDAQRRRLDRLRSLGTYDSGELEVAQRMIDQEEVRWADLER